MIRVVNRHNHELTVSDYNICRGTPLGNPFKIDATRTRAEAIAFYKNYIQDKIKNKDKPVCATLNNIYKEAKTRDVYLVCVCKPKSCHGDILKNILDEKLGYQT